MLEVDAVRVREAVAVRDCIATPSGLNELQEFPQSHELERKLNNP